MILILEALNALHGDALLLHFGEPPSPELMIIDGGPSGVYNQTLRDRLTALRKERSADEPTPPPLDVRLLIVSHMDADHIAGVIDLLEDLDLKRKVDEPYRIQSLWHNSFEDLVKTPPATADRVRTATLAANGQPLPGFEGLTAHGALVLASIDQGRKVRRLAEKLGIANQENEQLGTDLVALPDQGIRRETFGALMLTILGPQRRRVEKLREEWAMAVAEADTARAAAMAANDKIDYSVFNLSSIIVLAEADGRRILLTGDARGDDILAGLEAAGLTDKDGEIEVDVLKLPHHGSDRNVTREFFQRVKTKHYVVSANGRYKNPDVTTFELLTEARGKADYTISLTNEIDITTGKVHEACTFLRQRQKEGDRFKLDIRPVTAPSLIIPLCVAPGGKPASARGRAARPGKATSTTKRKTVAHTKKASSPKKRGGHPPEDSK